LSLSNGEGLVKDLPQGRAIPLGARGYVRRMTATTSPHSALATGSSDEQYELATRLYALVSCGHDSLPFNVDARGPALTVVGQDGRRRPVRVVGGEDAPPWQPARELVDGVERPRRFNPRVLWKHNAGEYSVAPAAPAWVQWVTLDIDAHAASPELAARRLARARADRVLGDVWRALNCSAERHPLLQRTPRAGYHLTLPLTRGPASANPEHTWPAAVARAWVERHLVEAGLELKPGVLEVYPSGRCLRAPCGRGMVMLQATRPDDPDALGLVPWPGTTGGARVDWRGERAELSTPTRRVAPMVRTYIDQWAAQRRTLADWLGRPEAAWDPAWGFLGWRDTYDEITSAEKNSGEVGTGQDSRSQESDDVPGREPAQVSKLAKGRPGRAGRGRAVDRSASSVPDQLPPPSEPDPDLPPDPAGGPLVRGRAFKSKVRTLLGAGVTEASTRHDAVLTLAFYWFATCGLPIEEALARLEAWCRAYLHLGSRLAERPRTFISTCLREARHYIEHNGHGWRRGRGDGGGLATLTPADQAVIGAMDPRLVDEVTAILAWLAGRAGDDGRIADPVQIASGLLRRLCGDRRVVEDGKRRRASVLALVELERVGVLTMASNYRVGQRGRTWACWYRFGSGELPRTVALPAEQWAKIEPFTRAPVAPSLAVVPSEAPEAPSSPVVEVRVLGERVTEEGLVRVLSDGARGVARTLITRAPGVGLPTVTPAAREPWFERMWRWRPFTPGRLWSSDPSGLFAFPDIEARRRMSRSERLAWGGGGTSAPTGSAPLAPVIALPRRSAKPNLASAPGAAGGADAPVAAPVAVPASADSAAASEPGRACAREVELRAELAAEVGEEGAAKLPLDLLEVVARAWGSHRGRGRGS